MLNQDASHHNDYLFYSGKSMRSQFRDGDYLVLTGICAKAIAVGDIIVFKSGGGEKRIIHRVVAQKKPGVFLTKGDDNSFIDPIPVYSQDVIGKVDVLFRNNRMVKVSVLGSNRLTINFLIVKLLFVKKLKKVVRLPYAFLKNTGVVRYFWSPAVKIIRCRGNNGQYILKYVLNNSTVAHYNTSEDAFICKKPYDLVLTKPQIK